VKVVFDTNVFVSAFVFPGSRGEQVFLAAQRRTVELHSSVAILTETAHVLRTKFGQADDDVRAALKMVSRAATIARPQHNVSVLEDEPDNRILECAVTANADLVVSGDKHLLNLKIFEGIPISRLADFLRSVGR
jgi:putative PIN family toxin of toxin-antitoxin system